MSIKMKDLKVGKLYQVKEGSFIYNIFVKNRIEEETYDRFEVLPLTSTHKMGEEPIELSWIKTGVCDYMAPTFYENCCGYFCGYAWVSEKNIAVAYKESGFKGTKEEFLKEYDLSTDTFEEKMINIKKEG